MKRISEADPARGYLHKENKPHIRDKKTYSRGDTRMQQLKYEHAATKEPKCTTARTFDLQVSV